MGNLHVLLLVEIVSYANQVIFYLSCSRMVVGLMLIKLEI